jgi:hypothetical protein
MPTSGREEAALARLQDQSTVVTWNSQLLVQVDASEERKLKILAAVNDKERKRSVRARPLDEEQQTITLEYHLLGDDLEGAELMNALGVMAAIADQVDELSAVIGSGTRAIDACSNAEGGDGSTPGTTGPTVEA